MKKIYNFPRWSMAQYSPFISHGGCIASIVEQKTGFIDLDLKAYFDTVNHAILLGVGG